MSNVLKINMPLERWNLIAKKIDALNLKRDDSKKINKDLYSSCKLSGRILIDLVKIELGAEENLKDPKFYN